MADLDTLLNTALTLADIATDLSVAAWRGDLAVNYKDDGSTITAADLEIEARWRDLLRKEFPSHSILGEEYGTDTGDSAYTWVLDPIDGTRAFGAGLLNYASLIGLCRDGVPVLGIMDLPLPDTRYVAAEGCGTQFAGRQVITSERSDLADAIIGLGNPDSFGPLSKVGYDALSNTGRLRVFDGGSPAYGALSRGLIDLCLNSDDLEAFDICALCPIVQEAGGVITDWSGQALTLASNGPIVAAASPPLHAAALALLPDLDS